MLDFAYQFAIQESTILKISVITPRYKRECIYCQRDVVKGYKWGTSEDATKGWRGQYIDRYEGLHKCNKEVWNEV